MSQLPKLCMKGEYISIKTSEDEYQQGLQGCKNNLQGRILLEKGSKPMKFTNLRAKLIYLWKPLNHWSMIPLGKSYYEFCFASHEDLRKVWSVGSWHLKPGLLRLFQWVPDFNPNTQKQTHVQSWIRIHNLPQEYCRPKLLLEISNGVGTPITLCNYG